MADYASIITGRKTVRGVPIPTKTYQSFEGAAGRGMSIAPGRTGRAGSSVRPTPRPTPRPAPVVAKPAPKPKPEPEVKPEPKPVEETKQPEPWEPGYDPIYTPARKAYGPARPVSRKPTGMPVSVGTGFSPMLVTGTQPDIGEPVRYEQVPRRDEIGLERDWEKERYEPQIVEFDSGMPKLRLFETIQYHGEKQLREVPEYFPAVKEYPFHPKSYRRATIAVTSLAAGAPYGVPIAGQALAAYRISEIVGTGIAETIATGAPTQTLTSLGETFGTERGQISFAFGLAGATATGVAFQKAMPPKTKKVVVKAQRQFLKPDRGKPQQVFFKDQPAPRPFHDVAYEKLMAKKITKSPEFKQSMKTAQKILPEEQYRRLRTDIMQRKLTYEQAMKKIDVRLEQKLKAEMPKKDIEAIPRDLGRMSKWDYKDWSMNVAQEALQKRRAKAEASLALEKKLKAESAAFQKSLLKDWKAYSKKVRIAEDYVQSFNAKQIMPKKPRVVTSKDLFKPTKPSGKVTRAKGGSLLLQKQKVATKPAQKLKVRQRQAGLSAQRLVTEQVYGEMVLSKSALAPKVKFPAIPMYAQKQQYATKQLVKQRQKSAVSSKQVGKQISEQLTEQASGQKQVFGSLRWFRQPQMRATSFAQSFKQKQKQAFPIAPLTKTAIKPPAVDIKLLRRTTKPKKAKKKKGVKRPYKYTPTLTGIVLGKTAIKKPKVITGLGIRPMVKRGK
jgi:hypothetical protein